MRKIILWSLAVVLFCASVVGIYSYVHAQNIKKPFLDLIFPVEDLKTGKIGYMDINGNIVIKPEYDFAYDFQPQWNGLTKVKNSGRYGLIDKKGNIVFPVQYSYLLNYDPKTNTVIAGNKIRVSSGRYENRLGYYKLDGTEILPEEYQYLSQFVNGKAIAQKTDGFWYIIDDSGHVVKELDKSIKYVFFYMYSSGYAAYTSVDPDRTLNDYGLPACGFIDTEGNIIFEMNPDTYVTTFENGRAVIDRVVKDDQDRPVKKTFIIDFSGTTVVDLGEYMFCRDGIGGFSDGVACGYKFEAGYGAIDANGNWVVEPKYKHTDYNDSVITARADDSHFLFFDKYGKKLLECNYPSTYYNDGYFFMLKNDRIYMVDINGNTIMQLPEGYMPSRCKNVSKAWDSWREQHTKGMQ